MASEPEPTVRLLHLALVAVAACSPPESGASAPEDLLPPPAELDALHPELARDIRARAAEARAQDDPMAAARLGVLYQANQMWREAGRAFARAADLDPSSSDWPYYEVLCLLEQDRAEEARALLAQAAARHADSAPLASLLLDDAYQNGRLDEALELARRVTTLEPERPEGWVGLGQVLIALERPEEAAAALERAVSLAPDYKEAHYLLGRAYRALGRLSEAEREMAQGALATERRLRADWGPDVSTLSYFKRGQIRAAQSLVRAGRTEEAVGLLRRSLELWGDDALVLVQLGITHRQAGQLEAALQAFDRAVAADPKLLDAHLNRAQTLVALGRYDEALEEALRARALGPGVAEVRLVEARALIGLGRRDDAAQALLAGLEHAPRHLQLLKELGDLYLELNRPSDAAEAFETLAQERPDLWEAQLDLARAAFEAGDRERARAACQAAHDLAPDQPAVAELLQRIGPAGG